MAPALANQDAAMTSKMGNQFLALQDRLSRGNTDFLKSAASRRAGVSSIHLKRFV